MVKPQNPRKRWPRKLLHAEVIRLYESGVSYREGAARLSIPVGTFSGTLWRARRAGHEISRLKYTDQSHRVTAKAVTLPKLKFMED